eukprot:gene5601-6290_t
MNQGQGYNQPGMNQGGYPAPGGAGGYPPAGGAGYPPNQGYQPPQTGAPMPGQPPQMGAPAPGPASMPSAPSFDKIAGYETAAGLAGVSAGPPPQPVQQGQPAERPEEHFDRAAVISDDEAKDALINFVAENCCYGKSPAEEMSIKDMKASSAYHYMLETFIESRTFNWYQEPYLGGPVDGPQNGPAPMPWSILVQHPPPFQPTVFHTEIPHTASVKVQNNCHLCRGKGHTNCHHCHGRGRDNCHQCHGDGHLHINGERQECIACHGHGHKEKIMKGEKVEEKTALPDELITQVNGTQIFGQEFPRVFPLTSFFVQEINAASQQLVNKHSGYANENIIHRQRHNLRVVPVNEAVAAWKDKNYRFWFSLRIRVERNSSLFSKGNGYFEKQEEDSEPEGKCFSFISKYMNGIFKKASSKTKLEISDLFTTLDGFKSSYLGNLLEREWQKEVEDKKDKGTPNLGKCLFRMNRWFTLFTGIFLLIPTSISLAMPYFVGNLIEYFTMKKAIPEWHAYLYAAAVSFSFIFNVCFDHAFYYHVECCGLKLRSAVVSLIYKKVIRLTQGAFSQTSTGQIINLISGDSQKLIVIYHFIHFLWIAPFLLIAGTGLLYSIVGVSAFSGIAVMTLAIPFQIFLGHLFAHLRRKVAGLTDERVSIMSELIAGIRAVKMYTWERPFSEIVQQIRRKEVFRILQTTMVRSLTMTSFICSSYLATLCILTTHYFVGGKLTSAKVFSVLALLQVLRFPLHLFFAFAVQHVAEASSSLKRIQDFLLLDEMKTGNIVSKPLSPADPGPSVVVKEIKASWNNEAITPTLRNIHFELDRENSLLMVVGPVGAGKTSLLMALCGEVPVLDGSISIQGSVAYVPQKSWIFSGTVQQNILFGEPYDADRYYNVVNACALVEDFRQFPDSDMTLVGERGVCISGGQKARIGLARAVYRNADVYLLDDPLSAVDAKVGKHLFDHCICGLLKNKIRILSTHQVHFLKAASQISCLQDGKQIHLATYNELNQMKFDVQSLISELSVVEKEWDRDSAIDFEEVRVAVKKPRIRTNSTTSRLSAHSSASTERNRHSHVNLSFVTEELPISKGSPPSKEVEEETKEGNISVKLYVKYFRSGGGAFFTLVLFLLCILAQLSLVAVDWWIGYWTSIEEDFAEKIPISKSRMKFYFNDNKNNNLYVYVGGALLAYVLVLSSILFFYNVAVTASRNMHNGMLNAILKAPLHFFDTTSTGKILNRFAKDTFFMDEELPWTFHEFVLFSLFTINAIAMSAVNVPYLLIILVPLFVMFILLRRYYLVGARDIKRLEGISRSPMFTHLSATLEGLASIRAFKATRIVEDEFYECQDHSSDGWFLFINGARWFAQKLDLILALFVISAIFIPLILLKHTSINPTLMGLTLLYVIQLNGLFQWCVRQSAQVENLMTSVERVAEYCELEPEQDQGTSKALTRGWPKYGIITAEGASFAHDKSLPYVLKMMFFCIRASEKVGVVGRTGAGKSSLIAAMFRTGKLMGTIRIDGVSTSDIALNDLRSNMSVIPQDPVLFIGTLRINIDPFNEFEDPDIWEVLEEVQLKDVVFKLENKLYTQVSEGGSNFSVGQRQLFCLARALLLRKKILFIDEATANVDHETDSLIQETIREKFRDCTVVTVAHRLNTVMDCDRIMVLKAGKIVQFDEPCELFQDREGEFRKIVDQTGRVEAARLEMMAKEAKEVKLLIRERTQVTYPGCKISRSKTKEEIMEMFGARVVYETSL